MPDDLEIEFRQIEAGDKLTGLSLGNDAFTPLKTYLQKHAKKYQAQNLARTYAAFRQVPIGKVVGYITLVCGEIAISENDGGLLADNDVEFHHRQYPAIKIARLAIDRRVQGKGLGSQFVQIALGVTKDTISPVVGCRFVVVDSKKESVSFYKKQGFTILDTEANKQRAAPVMFVDLHKIPAA